MATKRKRVLRSRVELPEGTVGLVDDVVPAVRKLLQGGLTEKFQKACVRVGQFHKYSGGLKADLVGGLRIDVHAVLKLGSDELHHHALTINHVNTVRENTFPTVLHLTRLPGGRVFIITEQCRKHVTLLNKVYREATTAREFRGILAKVFDSLSQMHRINRASARSLRRLPTSPDPFAQRLREKMRAALKADPQLATAMQRPGIVFNQPCPPVAQLLRRAATVCRRVAGTTRRALVHGDPHLANIMVRRSGATGYRVRLIDPNPEIGFSQPLYDIGKLFHWAEPVGWAKAKPSVCRSRLTARPRTRPWSLSATLDGESKAAERRRRWVESAVVQFAERQRQTYGQDFDRMLSISIASAHLGLAAILSKAKDKRVRRFVLAHALKHLMTLA